MVRNIPPTQVSTYFQYLPALFQQDVGDDGVSFTGRFLLAFEAILQGVAAPQAPGLEEILDRIHIFFNPGPEVPERDRAPAAFLPWLASWVGLTLREDWTEAEQRRLLSRMVPLYRLRGTKAGLTELLRTYTNEQVEVEKSEQDPHFFRVNMTLSAADPRLLQRKERIARAIIDQEKPAHTYYTLVTTTPSTFIVGSAITGTNTLL